MKVKIKINQQSCISCATCWTLDPNHFVQGNDGKAKVQNGQDDNDPKSEKVVTKCENCLEAANSCPVDAISIKEEEEAS